MVATRGILTREELIWLVVAGIGFSLSSELARYVMPMRMGTKPRSPIQVFGTRAAPKNPGKLAAIRRLKPRYLPMMICLGRKLWSSRAKNSIITTISSILVATKEVMPVMMVLMSQLKLIVIPP